MLKLLLLLLVLGCAPAFSQCSAPCLQTTNLGVFSSTTAGSLLVATCGSGLTADTVTGVTDAQGRTWFRAVYSGVNFGLFTYFAFNTLTSGVGSLTFTGGSCGRTWLSEWSGMATSSVVDGVSDNGGSSGVCDPGTITSTASNNVIYGVGMSNDGTVGQEAAGYFQLSTSGSEDSEYKVASSTSNDPTFTTTLAWECQGVAFKQAGGGGGGSTAPRRRVIN
jgi:hypothetical protein